MVDIPLPSGFNLPSSFKIPVVSEPPSCSLMDVPVIVTVIGFPNDVKDVNVRISTIFSTTNKLTDINGVVLHCSSSGFVQVYIKKEGVDFGSGKGVEKYLGSSTVFMPSPYIFVGTQVLEIPSLPIPSQLCNEFITRASDLSVSLPTETLPATPDIPFFLQLSDVKEVCKTDPTNPNLIKNFNGNALVTIGNIIRTIYITDGNSGRKNLSDIFNMSDILSPNNLSSRQLKIKIGDNEVYSKTLLLPSSIPITPQLPVPQLPQVPQIPVPTYTPPVVQTPTTPSILLPPSLTSPPVPNPSSSLLTVADCGKSRNPSGRYSDVGKSNGYMIRKKAKVSWSQYSNDIYYISYLGFRESPKFNTWAEAAEYANKLPPCPSVIAPPTSSVELPLPISPVECNSWNTLADTPTFPNSINPNTQALVTINNIRKKCTDTGLESRMKVGFGQIRINNAYIGRFNIGEDAGLSPGMARFDIKSIASNYISSLLVSATRNISLMVKINDYEYTKNIDVESTLPTPPTTIPVITLPPVIPQTPTIPSIPQNVNHPVYIIGDCIRLPTMPRSVDTRKVIRVSSNTYPQTLYLSRFNQTTGRFSGIEDLTLDTSNYSQINLKVPCIIESEVPQTQVTVPTVTVPTPPIQTPSPVIPVSPTCSSRTITAERIDIPDVIPSSPNLPFYIYGRGIKSVCRTDPSNPQFIEPYNGIGTITLGNKTGNFQVRNGIMDFDLRMIIGSLL